MAIRVGIIGAGWWAEVAHAPGLANAGAKITAVLSRTPAKAQKLAKKYNAKVFDNLADMDMYVDAVAIATANDTHVRYAAQALQMGLHVFMDKPVATNLKDALKLYKIHGATSKVGTVALTTLSSRGHPVTVRARELLESGALGDILYVRGHFHAEFMADPKTPLVWRAQRGPAGSGALGDLGAHLFDLASYVSGLKFEKVSALSSIAFEKRPGGKVENDDEVAMLAKMSGDVNGVFSLSRVHTGGPQSILVEVQGTKGAMRVRPALSVDARNGGLEFCKRDGVFKSVDLPDRLWGKRGQKTPWEMYWGEFAFTELGRRFLDAIDKGKQPSPGLLEGVEAQAVIDAAESSAKKNGVWTNVPKI
jgi:predicted dehydrogenase